MSSLFTTGVKEKVMIADLLEIPTPTDMLQLHNRVEHSYWASGSGLCFRKTAAEKLLPRSPEARDTAQQLYFKIGSVFETVVEQRFKDKGVFLDSELRVADPIINLSGRIDFVINFNGEILLVELKTCGKLPSAPRKGHSAQLLNYLALTGIERGIVWYISRNVADWHNPLLHSPFYHTPTEEELRRTIFNTAYGREWALQGGMPGKPDFMKKSYCGFCSMQDHCWNGEPTSLQTSIPDPVAATENANAAVETILEERADRRSEMYRYYGVDAVL